MVGFGLLAAILQVTSPNGEVTAAFDLADGKPQVELSLKGKKAGTMKLGPEYCGRGHGKYTVKKTSTRKVEKKWKPVWGFKSEYPENYTETTVELQGTQDEAMLKLELRAYNEGFAARYGMAFETYALDEVRRERIDFDLPAGTVAWPIAGTEATYPEEPPEVAKLHTGANWRMPFTLRTPEGVYASILEANTKNWPRSFLKADGKGGLRSVFARGTLISRKHETSPWRAVQLAETAGGLIERAYLVENLNDPCAVADAKEWVKPGLTSADWGELDNARLLEKAKIAKGLGFKYLQIDWGWYGTERPWTDEERAYYKKQRPDLKDGEWEHNTYADPYTEAKGYVPYHPYWMRLINLGRTGVNLDVPALVKELKKMDMGLCLYLHGIVMEAADLPKLFAHYEKWGLAGLKPGFVSWGSQNATDALRDLAALAAKHHLWLDIHDEQIPDGFERTWPNVMITEGGGGEEGHHPLHQDCALPFARCLAGPFDYTPQFFHPKRTQAHAAAMLVTYPGPTAVVRWSNRDIAGMVEKSQGVFDFVKRLPMNYDDTVAPVGTVSKELVVARKKDGTWYMGGISGGRPASVKFRLDFLDAGREYKMETWADGGKRSRETVRKGDEFAAEMFAGGGFVAIIE